MSKYKDYRRQRGRVKGKSYSREGQLRAIAHRMGMAFKPTDDWGTKSLLSDFELFKMGRNKLITNFMQKQDDFMELDIQIFDYQFERGYHNSKRRLYQTVFFIKSKHLGLPQFMMKPETIFHKIGSYFGMEDIDFERFPKFSGQYLLQSEDEEYVRFIMKDELLHFFSKERGWYMEGLNYYLVLYRLNHLFKANQIRLLYDKGMGIYNVLKQDSLLMNDEG